MSEIQSSLSIKNVIPRMFPSVHLGHLLLPVFSMHG